MKTNSCRIDCTGGVHSIATFGDAQLVRRINGPYELRGGSAADHADVKQWISLFLHEAAVSYPSPVARRTRSSGLARFVYRMLRFVGFADFASRVDYGPPRLAAS
jgi:hypothetical protein